MEYQATAVAPSLRVAVEISVNIHSISIYESPSVLINPKFPLTVVAPRDSVNTKELFVSILRLSNATVDGFVFAFVNNCIP